jgi:hypothetical protein
LAQGTHTEYPTSGKITDPLATGDNCIIFCTWETYRLYEKGNTYRLFVTGDIYILFGNWGYVHIFGTEDNYTLLGTMILISSLAQRIIANSMATRDTNLLFGTDERVCLAKGYL